MKKQKNDFTIRRISGLDPAQPCFKTADLSIKLDKTDAPFVDVIHTNGRYLSDLGLGLPEPIGFCYVLFNFHLGFITFLVFII